MSKNIDRANGYLEGMSVVLETLRELETMGTLDALTEDQENKAIEGAVKVGEISWLFALVSIAESFAKTASAAQEMASAINLIVELLEAQNK